MRPNFTYICRFWSRAKVVVGFIASGALLVVSGCVSHPPYPSTWSPLSQSVGQSCSDLSGSYSAQKIGTTVAAWALAAQLYDLSDKPKEDPFVSELKKVTRVVLSVSSSAVSADFLADRTVLHHVEIGEPQNRVKCDGHSLKITHWAAEAAPFVFSLGTRDTIFFRASDGSLVLRTGYTEGGTAFLVIPVGGSEYDWTRYASDVTP